MHLRGHLETIDDGCVTFSDDIPERLATVESRLRSANSHALDGYIAAAGLDAPEQPLVPPDDWLPFEPASQNLADAGITSVLWATGYGLDLSFTNLPVLGEWWYPKHSLGVTEFPGLYAIGLPWRTRHYSSTWVGWGWMPKP